MKTIGAWKKLCTGFVFVILFFPVTSVYAEYKCEKKVLVNTKNTIGIVMGVGDVCVKFKTVDGGHPVAVSLWKFEKGKTFDQGVVVQKCFKVDGYAKIWAGRPPVDVWGCVDDSKVTKLPGDILLQPRPPFELP